MARLVGVDLPRDKRMEVALTYIFGIGRTRSNEILAATGIEMASLVNDAPGYKPEWNVDLAHKYTRTHTHMRVRTLTRAHAHAYTPARPLPRAPIPVRSRSFA